MANQCIKKKLKESIARLNTPYLNDLYNLVLTIEENEAMGIEPSKGLIDEALDLSQKVLMLGCADLLSSPSSYIEKHCLIGSEEVLRFAVGRNVILHVESQQRVRDSARANSQVLSDYKWDSKTNYTGRVLAAQEKLVAYRLFNETTGEAIRVLEREHRYRHLIKDFRHPTVDLQWAFHAPLLAVLDANSNLYIYSVDENGQKLNKYLIILQEGDHTARPPGRLVWCPYVPEEECGSDEVYLLAVIQGTQINLFMLNKIKDQIGRTEVTYERVQNDVKGGMISLYLESEVTACRISPDATALAAATANGELVFYVMEDWENVQAANRIRPLTNSHIEELVFLDNLSSHNHTQDEQFWKYVVLSSDNGRRLALFECDTWQCCAKLRFESPNQINRMELLVEPSMRFLILADYDASNLFCIELCQPSSAMGVQSLCFAACTQITFCNPMICVVPCLLTEQYDSAGDLSLEDEDQGLGIGNNSAIASLVAITGRSLLELNVELDRVLTVDPTITSVSMSSAATSAQPPLPQPLARNNQQQLPPLPTLPMPMPPSDPPAGMGLDTEQYDAALADMFGRAETATVTTAKNHINQGVVDNQINNNNQLAAANGEAMVEEVKEVLEQKFGDITKKIEELSSQVRELQEENSKLRANQADNLSNVLEKISNELKAREDRLETFVARLSKESSENVLRSVESFLIQHSVNVQRTVDLAQTKHSEQMHMSLERSVVPQVEIFCTHLFTQLNDKFRAGLQDFTEQLKTISQQQLQQIQAHQLQQQKAAHPQPQLTPMEKLNRLLENDQLKAAFELALNQPKGSDPKQKLLMTVCKKIDPDTFFNAANSSAASVSPTASPPPPLPVPVLLQLLLQLSANLDVETELKFRYVENALLALNTVVMNSRQAAQTAKAMGTGEGLRTVMERLGQAFGAFGERDMNNAWKRQIRLMNQLIANMLTIH